MNELQGFNPPHKKISLLKEKIKIELNTENISEFKENSIELKKVLSLIKEKRTEILAPLKEEIKEKEKIFKSVLEEIEISLNEARHKLLDYQILQENVIKEEKRKEFEKLNNSKDHNDLIAKTKVLTKTFPQKEKKVISYREKIAIEWVDLKQINRKYLIPDERKILNDIKKGIAIQGVKIKREKIPILR